MRSSALLLCLLASPALAEQPAPFEAGDALTAKRLNDYFDWLSAQIQGLSVALSQDLRGVSERLSAHDAAAELERATGRFRDAPAEGCLAAYEAGLPSGLIWIQMGAEAMPKERYCEQSIQGHEGGWMLIQNSTPHTLSLEFWRSASLFTRRGRPSLEGNYYDGDALFLGQCERCLGNQIPPGKQCVYGCLIKTADISHFFDTQVFNRSFDVLDVIEDLSGEIFTFKLGRLNAVSVDLINQNDKDQFVVNFDVDCESFDDIGIGSEQDPDIALNFCDELLAGKIVLDDDFQANHSGFVDGICKVFRPDTIESYAPYYFGCNPNVSTRIVSETPSIRRDLAEKIGAQLPSDLHSSPTQAYIPVQRISRFIRQAR